MSGTNAAATYSEKLLDKNEGVTKAIGFMEVGRDSSAVADELWKPPLEGWVYAWLLSTYPVASGDSWKAKNLDSQIKPSHLVLEPNVFKVMREIKFTFNHPLYLAGMSFGEQKGVEEKAGKMECLYFLYCINIL